MLFTIKYYTGFDEIRLKLLSFLSNDDIGLCTRCGQNQLRACLHGERVTLVIGELPYHPGQLYQLCWRVSSCMSFFDDPRFQKNLEVLYENTQNSRKRGKYYHRGLLSLCTGPKLVWGEAQKDEKEQRRCWWPSYDWIIRWNLVSNCIRLFQRVLMRISRENEETGTFRYTLKFINN